MSNQKLYRVTISRTFSFPSAVIDEGNFLDDLYGKAVQDFIGSMTSKKFNISDFEHKLEAELPFSIKSSRKKEPEIPTDRSVTLDFILKEIAMHDFEEAHGPMNYEKNPDIFVKPAAYKDFLTGKEIEQEPYLKEEFEQIYHDLIDEYYSILRPKLLQ